jgi:hypothetical protein
MRTTTFRKIHRTQEYMQVNKRVVPVVKGTKAVLAQTHMGAFFIRSVSDKIFAMLFLPKPPADHLAPMVLGPRFTKHYSSVYVCMHVCTGLHKSLQYFQTTFP